MPKGFRNGGWLFSTLALIFACILTTYCILLLLKVRNHCGNGNYRQLGQRSMGRIGGYLVDVALMISQASFTCAFVVFIVTNTHEVLLYFAGISVSDFWIAVGIFMIFTPLTWVRKISKFASFNIFADISILATIVVLIVYAGMYIGDK
jgi:proton-coupled amino acid transporter